MSSDVPVPIVDYLVLEPEPHLLAWVCVACGARFFDRRNGCASCGSSEFKRVQVSSTGHLRAFTVVHRAAPGIRVPFVSAIVETDDRTFVRSNLLVEHSDPAQIRLPMPVRLTTYAAGIDSRGTECAAFGYVPLERPDRPRAET